MSKTVFIISGEESGDNHGASLIRELKGLDPELSISGMGGGRMREAGQKGLDFKDISVVGIVEVIKKLPEIKVVFKKLVRMLDDEKPGVVVLIDFPDFNLRFAKEAKKRGVPVVYYISPQVWAWRSGRIRKIARLVDKMLVVFPFEVEIYEEAGVDVEFVGHPLVDSAVSPLSIVEAKAEFGFVPTETVAALLPGSRTEEVERLLPVMLDAVQNISDISRFRMSFLLSVAANIEDSQIEKHLEGRDIKIQVVRGSLPKVLRASNAALVASGTATLETALIGTPMVIVYSLSPLSYRVGKLLVNLECVGLPNIVLGEKFVPELIQKDATAHNMCEELLLLLECSMTSDKAVEGFKRIREALGEGGASAKAAKAVMKAFSA